MPIADDWTIDPITKTIQHTAGSTVYTVNEFYTFLSDIFDDFDKMPEPVPIRANTPTIYTWLNGWKMADETSYQFLKSGALQDPTNGDVYVNIQTIGSIVSGSQIYIYRSDGTSITEWWPTGHVDILVKIKEAGSLISNGQLTLFVREYGNIYDHFDLDASNKLTHTVALSTSDDFFNNTPASTVATYTDITLTWGTINRDLDDGLGLADYDLEIDCAGRPLQEVFEFLKYETRRGSTTDLNGVPGERYISIDPANYTIDKKAPFGTYVGGKWFVAQGIWLTNYPISDEENFELIDSAGVTHTPPLNLGFQLTGLQSGSYVAIYNTNTGEQIAKFDNTGTSVIYRYTYIADIPIRVVIMHLDYDYQEFQATLSNIDSVIPITQEQDPLYLNS